MTLEKQVKEMAGLQLQLDTEREEKRLLQEQLQEAEVRNIKKYLCNLLVTRSAYCQGVHASNHQNNVQVP